MPNGILYFIRNIKATDHISTFVTPERHKLYNMFLIAPQTSDKRIQKIDSISDGFIYMVSDSSITGAKNIIDNRKSPYKYCWQTKASQ